MQSFELPNIDCPCIQYVYNFVTFFIPLLFLSLKTTGEGLSFQSVVSSLRLENYLV